MEKSILSFTVIEGNFPLLVSAPHSGIHKRPSLTNVYRPKEIFTDKICIDVCRKTGASGIYLNTDIEYDPNYYGIRSNEYKRKVIEIIKKEKKKLFIDIHGLNDIYQYDIGVYYPSHFTKSKKVANDLREYLERGNLRGISINIFRVPDNDQKTLCKFTASKLRIPSLQIEVAKYIREDNQLRELLVEDLSSFLILTCS